MPAAQAGTVTISKQRPCTPAATAATAATAAAAATKGSAQSCKSGENVDGTHAITGTPSVKGIGGGTDGGDGCAGGGRGGTVDGGEACFPAGDEGDVVVGDSAGNAAGGKGRREPASYGATVQRINNLVSGRRGEGRNGMGMMEVQDRSRLYAAIALMARLVPCRCCRCCFWGSAVLLC